LLLGQFAKTDPTALVVYRVLFENWNWQLKGWAEQLKRELDAARAK
jgi:hypothetical protein